MKPTRRILSKQSFYLQYDKGYNHSYDEWEAYHKEINSELLEALKWFVSQEEDVLPNMPAYDEGIKKAKQAIAKGEK